MNSAFEKKLLEFYKGRYEAEADRRDKSVDRLTFGLLIISIIGNISLVYLEDLPPFTFGGRTGVFYILLLLGLAAGAAAITFYILALVFRNEFWYLPSPHQIAEYVAAAEVYNTSRPADPIDVEKEFDKKLAEQYRDYASLNAATNDRRGWYIYRTSLYSVMAIVFLLMCAPIFFLNKADTKKVEITKPVKVQAEPPGTLPDE
jgi:hypothetical protein